MRHTDAPSPRLEYIRQLYAPETPLMREIAAWLLQKDRSIHIGPEEGRLLQLLVMLHGAQRVLEIGTLAGYSALWMASGLPADGELVTLEKDPQMAEKAQQYIARADIKAKITVLEGDAHTILPELSPPLSFDICFIDADKISYPAYLDQAERLVRQGGLIIADNTLLFDTVYLEKAPEHIAPTTWKAMRLFNERLADTSRYTTTMLPTQEGLTVAYKHSV